MNKIKISHETNLSLLNRSLEFNDYQYILPHLIDKYPEYKEFMLNYRQQDDSFIIMDNGLFEGVEHTDDDLIEKINIIEPDIFIVPDAWNDSETTANNAEYWIEFPQDTCNIIVPSKTRFMVVLQGESFEEIEELFLYCYDQLGYRCFAINFSSSSYQIEFPHKNKLVAQMLGRISLVNRINSIINIRGFNDVYFHLLGCSLPQEFIYYKDYNFINSVDTSNPIITGALGQRYEEYGLLSKPSEKIEIFMEEDLESQYSNIKFNIHKFRSFVNSKIPSEHIIGQ